jgi:hypothetical protein
MVLGGCGSGKLRDLILALVQSQVTYRIDVAKTAA